MFIRSQIMNSLRGYWKYNKVNYFHLKVLCKVASGRQLLFWLWNNLVVLKWLDYLTTSSLSKNLFADIGLKISSTNVIKPITDGVWMQKYLNYDHLLQSKQLFGLCTVFDYFRIHNNVLKNLPGFINLLIKEVFLSGIENYYTNPYSLI